jgi:hypothetical protein
MAGCPVLQLTKTKTLRISAAVLLLVALYALAGFALAPRVLRSALLEDIPKTVGAEQLDPASKAELLLQLYEKNFGGEPKFPESVTSVKEKSGLATAKADYLSHALHEHIAVTDADLAALGEQRATAVQRALLTDTEIDPARVFMVANGKAKDQDGQVRLELSLK